MYYNILMNRILFFVHFNKYDSLSEYVVYALSQMKDLYNKVIFISNSPLSDSDKKRLADLQDKIIIRSNEGFDFAAYREGMEWLGWGKIGEYDNVTIMNDTCFGPIFPMKSVYEKMEKTNSNFWGITDHRAVDENDFWHKEHQRTYPYHLQAYFVCFDKKVVQSPAFRTFFTDNATTDNTRAEVVEKCELGLTPYLVERGFKSGSFFETANFAADHAPVFARYPDQLVGDGVPLIKIKSYTYDTLPKHITQSIAKNSDYPVDLIDKHLGDIYAPDMSLLMSNKILQKEKSGDGPSSIGVHLHVFYLDVFEKYLALFDKWKFHFDLFVTTDSDKKRGDIKKILRSKKTKYDLKKIVVTGPKGRDVIPWLTISAELRKYEVAGHFHTKKRVSSESWVGELWQNDLFDTLIVEAPNILANFAADPNVGIIIPDIPEYFRYDNLSYKTELAQKDDIAKLWHRIGSKKSINFDEQLTYVMSYGTMFWYRPDALRNLTDLELNDDEIPAEPVPQDGTILHAIERLVVYAAWDRGYDYRISSLKTYVSGFVDNVEYNRKMAYENFQTWKVQDEAKTKIINKLATTEHKLDLILRSHSYRTTQILKLPRKLAKKIQRRP